MGVETLKQGPEHRSLLAVAMHEKYRTWKLERVELETKWHRLEKQFIGQLPDDTELEEFKSQRPFPLAWEAAQNVAANMKRAMFPNDYFFGAEGMTAEAKDTEEVREALMRDRLTGMKFTSRYDPHMMQLLMFGNSCHVRGWQKSPARQNKDSYEYVTDGQTQTYTKASSGYDGPYFEHISVYDAVIDTRAREHDSALKMYRVTVSKQTIRDGVKTGRYQFAKALLEMKGGGEEYGSDSQEKSRQSERGINEGTAGDDPDAIDLIVGHGDFEHDGKFYRNYIFEIGNDKHLIRLEPNSFDSGQPPIKFTTLFCHPGQTYGLGILEVNEGMHDLIQVRENQLADALNLILNPVWIGKDDGVLDLDNLVIKPGAFIMAEDPENIRAMEMPMQALAAMGDIGHLKMEYTDGTFSHKNFGANVERRTATEVATSAAMMSAVVDMLVRKLETEDIEPMLTFFDEMEQQFFDETEDITTRLEDSGQVSYQRVGNEVIYADYRWKSRGSGFTHLKEAQQQQMMAFSQSAAQLEELRFAVDWEAVGKDFLQGMNKRDVDKLVPGYKAMLQKASQNERFSPLVQGAQQGGPPGASGASPASGAPDSGGGPSPGPRG